MNIYSITTLLTTGSCKQLDKVCILWSDNVRISSLPGDRPTLWPFDLDLNVGLSTSYFTLCQTLKEPNLVVNRIN